MFNLDITDTKIDNTAFRLRVKFGGFELLTKEVKSNQEAKQNAPVESKSPSARLKLNSTFVVSLNKSLQELLGGNTKEQVLVELLSRGHQLGVGRMSVREVCWNENTLERVAIKSPRGREVGVARVGVFTAVTKSHMEKRVSKKKKWFEKKADKEDRHLEKNMGRMMNFLFTGDPKALKKLRNIVEKSKGAEAEAKVMYALMKLVKTPEGRDLFTYKIDPENLPCPSVERLGPCVVVRSERTFEYLAALYKAALREGIYTRDFASNKSLMDTSYLYIFTRKDETLFMFQVLADGITLTNLDFWESTFVEMDTLVNPPSSFRAQSCDANGLAGDGKTMSQGDQLRKTRLEGLLPIFLRQMIFFCKCSPREAYPWAERIVLMFGLSETLLATTRAGIDKHIDESHFSPATGPTNADGTPRSGARTGGFLPGIRPRQVNKHDDAIPGQSWVRHDVGTGGKVAFYHNTLTNQVKDAPIGGDARLPASPDTTSSASGMPSLPTAGAEVSRSTATSSSVPASRNVPVVKSPHPYLFREVKVGIIRDCCLLTKVGQPLNWKLETPRKFRSAAGCLVITNYRLEFICFENPELNELIPIHSLERFNVQVFTVTTASGISQETQVIAFFTKCMRTVRVTSPYNKDMEKLMKRIKHLAFPKKITGLFAFQFRVPVSQSEDGWNLFSVKREFSRQKALDRGWRLSKVNNDFKFSPTYPQKLCVPAWANDEDLVLMSKFRSKQRMPVLTYYMARSGAAILRSSQPLIGVGGRCKEEEEYFKAVHIRMIYDARPLENAFANRAKGGGYEDTRYYSTATEPCELRFCDVANIHKMRNSLASVISACEIQQNRRTEDINSALERTRWISYVRNLIIKSYEVARDAESGTSLLVHCSDGWDRTAQICGLAQVFLDPYFRTIEGLGVLVEKDWCYFGHKFHTRIGHASGRYSDTQRSPIFVQFLDALWQIWKQSPQRFEYDERLLTFLAEHVSSCKYGTFLFDTQRERRQYKLAENTVSIWTHVVSTNRADFVNPLYNASLDAQCPPALNFHPDARLFSLWPFYYRQDIDMLVAKKDAGWVIRGALELERAKARAQIEWLKTRIRQLEEKDQTTRKEHSEDMKLVRQRLRDGSPAWGSTAAPAAGAAVQVVLPPLDEDGGSTNAATQGGFSSSVRSARSRERRTRPWREDDETTRRSGRSGRSVSPRTQPSTTAGLSTRSIPARSHASQRSHSPEAHHAEEVNSVQAVPETDKGPDFEALEGRPEGKQAGGTVPFEYESPMLKTLMDPVGRSVMSTSATSAGSVPTAPNGRTNPRMPFLRSNSSLPPPPPDYRDSGYAAAGGSESKLTNSLSFSVTPPPPQRVDSDVSAAEAGQGYQVNSVESLEGVEAAAAALVESKFESRAGDEEDDSTEAVDAGLRRVDEDGDEDSGEAKESSDTGSNPPRRKHGRRDSNVSTGSGLYRETTVTQEIDWNATLKTSNRTQNGRPDIVVSARRSVIYADGPKSLMQRIREGMIDERGFEIGGAQAARATKGQPPTPPPPPTGFEESSESDDAEP